MLASHAPRGFVPILRGEFDAYAAEKGLDFDEENLLHRLLGHAHWSDGTVPGGYTHLAALWRMGPSGRRRLARLLGRLAEKGTVEIVADTGRDDGYVRVVDYARLVANGDSPGRTAARRPVQNRAAGRAFSARPTSPDALLEIEQVQEPPYPPAAEQAAKIGPEPAETTGGEHPPGTPNPAGPDPAEPDATEVFTRFGRIIPDQRRDAYDRQTTGPGGQRLLAAVAAWLHAGGDLDQLVAQAVTGPLPPLVHNWPAFLAARVEALDPPGQNAEAAAAERADLDAEAAQRRAEEDGARVELAVAEAEALALSGMLDDNRLAAVADRVTRGLAGPLARSPLAVARAVVVWCREAAERRPGPLLAAVDAGLADASRCQPGDGEFAPRLALPTPPGGTSSLRKRVASILTFSAQVGASS